MANLSFGEWLQRRRGAEGWTQKQLAQKINCSISTLRKLESEERRPSVQVVERLAVIFSTPQNEHKSFLRFARGDWQAFSNEETTDAPWRISHPAASNLPASLSSFVGRKKEQVEILNLLTKSRLVTLAGVGGIGKTRISLQIGNKLLRYYPNGVWFVALESLSDPTLIPQTVAAVFDIRETSEQPVVEVLKNVLREKTTLLIFDNCEHLLEACAQLITTLLQSCPKLNILATSRGVLGISGEATYFLDSLSIPDPDRTPPEKFNEYESIQLFSDRATLALTSFTLTNDDGQAVIDICRRVDGIPLAIELAAAHVNILKVTEISHQLQSSFVLLSTDNRMALSRHQTMQASLYWSWGLLNEGEQKFMRQLAIFAGGWTLEAAQAVCDGDALNLISTLVKKSLIVVEQESGRGTRYRFHEIVRQYAHGKLSESALEEVIRTRHLMYFLQFSEQAEVALRGPVQMEWYARLLAERDNIRAALEWANETDVQAGLYVSARLHRFWDNFDLSEGARWLAGFLQKAEPNHYPLARAKALCIQARIMSVQDYNFAYIEAQESLDLYRANGDKSGEIDALLALGQMLKDFNAPIEKVMNLFEHALTLSESLGDQWRQAYTLSHMGWLNNYQRSISTFEKAVAIFKKVGDLELSTNTMLDLVMRNMLNGNLQSAEKWLDEVVKTSQNLNNKGLQANILHHYGCIALIRGDYEMARTNLLEAMEMSQAIGHRIMFLWTHVRLGYVALREDKLAEARSIFAKTMHNFQEDQNASGVVFTLEGMASLKILLDKHERAACLIGWADATRKKIGDPRPPLEQADVDQIIAACRAKMDEVTFSDAYDDGKKMTLDEAVAYALQER